MFRAAGRPYGAVGLLAGFFLLIGTVLLYENRGAWPVLVITGGATLFALASLAWLRLEIGVQGIRYRTVGGTRFLEFGDIERAYFETMVNRAAPHGVHIFCVKPKEGKVLRLDLRALRAGAAPRLLTTLERHGIPITLPEGVAPRVGGGRARASRLEPPRGFWR